MGESNYIILMRLVWFYRQFQIVKECGFSTVAFLSLIVGCTAVREYKAILDVSDNR